MELLKVTDKCCTCPLGIICSWSLLLLLAAACIPYLAIHGTEVKADNFSSDGSGHGHLPDILDFSDDDSSDDDDQRHGGDKVDKTDDGGGGWEVTAETGGGPTHKEKGIGQITDLGTPEVMCFHCHGDGTNGCDVVAMMYDTRAFSVPCSGKCLNVSSGHHSVYDCALDMQIGSDKCLNNDETTMCFCTGHFCNGPSTGSPFVSNIQAAVLSQDQQLPIDKDLNYDITRETTANNHKDLNYNITRETTANNHKDLNYDITRETANKPMYEFSNKSQVEDMETNCSDSNTSRTNLIESRLSRQNFSHSIDYEIFAENVSVFQEIKSTSQNGDDKNMNFIIPVNSSRVPGESTASTLNVGSNGLRAGSLKDGSLASRSADSCPHSRASNVLLSLLLILKCNVRL